MLHHATRSATPLVGAFTTILEAAARRAWVRTKPGRAYPGGTARAQSSVVEPRTRDDDNRPAAEGRKQRVPRYSRSFLSQLPIPKDTPEGSVTYGGCSSLHPEMHSPTTTPIARVLSLPEAYSAFLEVDDARSSALCPHERTCCVQDAPVRARSPGAKRALLTYISPECLSDDDFTAIDPGLDPFPDATTDPPWQEVLASLPESISASLTVHYGPYEPPLPARRPNPRSATGLYRNLLFFRISRPTLSLETLIDYHGAFREYQTTRSFNLLITLALRLVRYGTARALFRDMQARGTPPDSFTRQLRVRLLLRDGTGWHTAWREQFMHAQDENRGMPLSVWLEFFAVEHNYSLRRWRHSTTQPSERELAVVPPVEFKTLEKRHQILMQNLPTIADNHWTRIPSRAIRQIVRILILTNHREHAITITSFLFRLLPEKLPPRWNQACLDIVHLHMLPGPRRGLPHYNFARKLFFKLIRLRPDLQPSATTLFLLMQHLKRSTNGIAMAQPLVYHFVARWGHRVVDDKVRRLLASLAIKGGDLRVADAVDRSQKAVEEARQKRAAEQSLKNEHQHDNLSGKRAFSAALAFSRRGEEGWQWRLLRRRLWQAMQKRRSRGPVDVADGGIG
ncbi:uncharacterized protein LAESUDRAFT_759755 [Laetiporus sulphureus 93-53]|uniref:Uncharacterized protein n=1 Tax=Laetiporus sulphureus 93-53 TaxID=1314785 RepID=A0A165DXZ4_9APHY|nr:uncharacterized protein LAESUDRAFT_759755 [Laetiporus sulphureus 93-53]KZT05849.1 hypothetical protein LAESUDRAFT_759755 [Laetiporus sulphureus 93-53]